MKESPDLLAVRTRSRRSVGGKWPVPRPAAEEVVDGELVAEFPDAGVEIYRVPTETRSLNARKTALRYEPDTQFTGSVLVRPKSGEPVIYTENVYIRFQEEMDPDDCESVIREAGLSVKERLDFATNAYFAVAAEGTGQQVFDIALELLKRDDLIHCHPELIERRVHKAVFDQQWHLKATTVGGTAC